MVWDLANILPQLSNNQQDSKNQSWSPQHPCYQGVQHLCSVLKHPKSEADLINKNTRTEINKTTNLVMQV